MKNPLVVLLLVMVSLTLVGCGKQETPYCDQYTDLMKTMLEQTPGITPEHAQESAARMKEEINQHSTNKDVMEMWCKSIVDNKDAMIKQQEAIIARQKEMSATIINGISEKFAQQESALSSGLAQREQESPLNIIATGTTADATGFPACDNYVKMLQCKYSKIPGMTEDMIARAINGTKMAREVQPADKRDAACQRFINEQKDEYAKIGCVQ